LLDCRGRDPTAAGVGAGVGVVIAAGGDDMTARGVVRTAAAGADIQQYRFQIDKTLQP